MTKWINVKDRLPEKEDRYLVCYLSKNYLNETKPKVNTLKWEYYGPHSNPKKRWHGTEIIRAKYITHWMPLPEFPSEYDKCSEYRK